MFSKPTSKQKNKTPNKPPIRHDNIPLVFGLSARRPKFNSISGSLTIENRGHAAIQTRMYKNQRLL